MASRHPKPSQPFYAGATWILHRVLYMYYCVYNVVSIVQDRVLSSDRISFPSPRSIGDDILRASP
jgi:hypothetical protein